MNGLSPSTAEDRAEIAALVLRYAQFVRQGRGEACSSLFTENSVYNICEVDGAEADAAPRLRARLEGSSNIHDYLSGSTARGIRLCPMIHNLLIDIDGDHATATSVMESRTWPDGHGTIGEYDDSFRREQGRWLFASRKYTMYLAPAAGEAT